MSKWRPNNWPETTNSDIELGADWILGALRKGKTKVTNLGDPPQGDGVVVFIPDDLKEKTEKPFDPIILTDGFIDLGEITTAIRHNRLFDKWWHPATKIIESGYFCKKCGKQYSGSQIKTCLFTERYGGDKGRGIDK